MSDLSTTVRFSIQADPGGWRWTTFDAQGRRRAGGLTASRALAAALVIRDICAAQAPQPISIGVDAKAA